MSNGEATVINDRYEVHKRIGRGGMADVFSARDLLLDRQVAIKVLFPEFATDANFVERFRREAQSAANLSHPNIVNVYDWGKYQGTYFIAMEEVQGRTLADILKTNKQLTSKQAAEIASEVAAALGFAHEGDVAHRDIKPANILIGSNGQVKVADFGIARAMNAPTEANLTQVGSVMGTATYFSPEQAQGAQPDPRSDLYSLGIVMYEMVAGRPPFTGENPVSIAYKQVHDSPQPLVQLVADVPRAFEAIVAKLLAKDPKLRYPSAGALRDDLRRFRNGETVQALSAAASAQNVTLPGEAQARQGPATRSTGAVPRPDPHATAISPAVDPVRPRSGAVPSTGMLEAGYPPGASAEAMYYDSNSSRTGWYALAAFVALIGLVVGGVLLFQSLTREDPAAVEPQQFVLDDYFNKELDDVVADLRRLELVFTTVAEPNADVPVGFVHRTEPVAGAVMLEGQAITVYFNPDQNLRPIPNVVGLPLADARLALEAEGFILGPLTTQQTDEFEENTVIASDPMATTQAKQGTAVNLTVAGRPDSVTVPGFIVGLTEQAAREVLEGEPYLFQVTVERQASDSIPAGTVISVTPGGGELIARNGAITLLVSDGPEPITVPQAVGLVEGTARNLLTDLGLNVDVVRVNVQPGDPSDGRVRAQSLAPGSLADPGTLVTLEVGQALDPITTLPPTTTTTTTLPPATTAAPTTVVATTTAAATTAAPAAASTTVAAP